MECKKLAWRAAGTGKWTGYEGVAGSSIGGGASAVSGAVVSKRRDINAWRAWRRRNSFTCMYIS